MTLPEDNTPFLSEQHTGHPAWRVTVRDWSPQGGASHTQAREPKRRTVDVILDAADGTLIKIETRWPQDEPCLVPALDAKSEEKGMLHWERYHGFPDKPPPVSFAEALEIMDSQGAYPEKAKQIVGRWVIWSEGSGRPKPVWAITLRSVWPSVLTLQDADAAARTQWRYIVDPVAKRLICWGNF
jgi:hypothetical protein